MQFSTITPSPVGDHTSAFCKFLFILCDWTVIFMFQKKKGLAANPAHERFYFSFLLFFLLTQLSPANQICLVVVCGLKDEHANKCAHHTEIESLRISGVSHIPAADRIMGSRCFLAPKGYKTSSLKSILNWLINWFRCPIRILVSLYTFQLSLLSILFSLHYVLLYFVHQSLPLTPHIPPYLAPPPILLSRFLPFCPSLSPCFLSLFLFMSLPPVIFTSPFLHPTLHFPPCLCSSFISLPPSLRTFFSLYATPIILPKLYPSLSYSLSSCIPLSFLVSVPFSLTPL